MKAILSIKLLVIETYNYYPMFPFFMLSDNEYQIGAFHDLI